MKSSTTPVGRAIEDSAGGRGEFVVGDGGAGFDRLEQSSMAAEARADARYR